MIGCRRVGGLLFCAVLAALTGASPAAADVGYVSDGILGWFTTMQVPGGQIGAFEPPHVPTSGLAISPSGELFGVMNEIPGPGPRRLVRIDPATHAIEVRGPLMIASASWYGDTGLAFDATGRLWLVTEEGRLYRVDPSNAAATLRADLGIPVNGLAGCGAALFTLRKDGEPFPLRLVRIDPGRGTFTTVGAGTSEVWHGSGAGLDFAADGRLWAVLRNDPTFEPAFPESFLAEFDPATGELLSHVSHFGTFEGFALAPPPATCRGLATPEVPSLSRSGLWVLAAVLSLVAATAARRGSSRRRGSRG